MKSINKLFCGLLIILFTNSYSQQLNCQWLNYCETGPSYVNDVCVDFNGNSIAMGYFKNIDIQGVSLTSNPYESFNIYICKMDSIGNLLWLKNAGEGSCRGKSIKADSEGNIIFSGYFNSYITLCDTTFIEDNYVGEFIMKFDENGNCLWAKYVDFIGTFGPIPIVLDNDDNIYLLTMGNTIIDGHSCNGETVITKFNKYGEILWMQSTSIEIWNFASHANNTVIMSSGNLIIGGYYKDTISFAGNTYISGIEMSIDPWTGDTTFYSSREVLIGIMDTSGTEIIAINITADGDFTIEAVTANSLDDIYVSGVYYSDSINIANFYLIGGEGYIARFSNNIDLLEAKNIDDIHIEGAVTTNNFTYYSSNNSDYMYINKYDFNCNFVDSIIIGANNQQPEHINSLAKFPNNDILLGGHYVSELIIDSLIAPGDPGSNYKFLCARLGDPIANLSQHSFYNKIVLYPNPISDKLNVDIDQFRYMELYDIRGNLIIGNIKEKEIYFQNYNNGIYILRIFTNNNLISRKLVKQ